MDERLKKYLMEKAAAEPFALLLGIRVIKIDDGYACCEMTYRNEMDNIHGMAHGGAVFSLIDEAFELSSNSHGTMAVALSMNVTYLKPAVKNTRIRAESKEVHCGRKTATYQITVEDDDGLIALCQALVYRKKERLQVPD